MLLTIRYSRLSVECHGPTPPPLFPHHSGPLGRIYPLAQAWLNQTTLASAALLSLVVSPPSNYPPPFYFRSPSLGSHTEEIQVPSFQLFVFQIVWFICSIFHKYRAVKWKPIPVRCRILAMAVVTLGHEDGCRKVASWWETRTAQGYTNALGRGINCVTSYRWLLSWGLTEILFARVRCITDGEAAAQVMHGDRNEQSGGTKTNLLCIFVTFSGVILN